MSTFSRVIVPCLLAGLCACGSSDGPDFTGTWTYDTGSTTTMCPTGTNMTTLTGNDAFSDGTDSDLVVDSDGCVIKYNIDGDTAEALPGQACSATQAGVTATLAYSSASYVSQGDKLVFTGAGTFTTTGSGNDVTCSASATGTLHKVSN